MTLKLMGKKRGMTQQFDAEGNCIVCTVIEAEPNVVVAVKTKESDGYQAIQTGFETLKGNRAKRQEKIIGKPLSGSFKKAGVEPRLHLIETRQEGKKAAEYQVGQEIAVTAFKDVKYVDLQGVSKGKGYQGVMKLHGYSGIGRSHGTGPVHRHAGSIGMRSTPGRCLPGGKRASRMGGKRVTVQNLEVVNIDEKRNLLLVKGAVPGAIGALVFISQAKKRG